MWNVISSHQANIFRIVHYVNVIIANLEGMKHKKTGRSLVCFQPRGFSMVPRVDIVDPLCGRETLYALASFFVPPILILGVIVGSAMQTEDGEWSSLGAGISVGCFISLIVLVVAKYFARCQVNAGGGYDTLDRQRLKLYRDLAKYLKAKIRLKYHDQHAVGSTHIMSAKHLLAYFKQYRRVLIALSQVDDMDAALDHQRMDYINVLAWLNHHIDNGYLNTATRSHVAVVNFVGLSGHRVLMHQHSSRRQPLACVDEHKLMPELSAGAGAAV